MLFRSIKQCEKQGKNDEQMYSYCLQRNLGQKILALSSPCRELGEKGLWSTQNCQHLVSYIFMSKFDDILEQTIAQIIGEVNSVAQSA